MDQIFISCFNKICPCHNIAEILLKLTLNTNQSINVPIFGFKFLQSKNSSNMYVGNIHTVSANITFICTSFRNRKASEPLTNLSFLFRGEYK